MSFYKAMGQRKIYSLFSWNPLSWWPALVSLAERYSGIEGNMVGEGVVLGGVLVVSKEKGVVYQYDEITGHPLPVEDIADAIKNNSA